MMHDTVSGPSHWACPCQSTLELPRMGVSVCCILLYRLRPVERQWPGNAHSEYLKTATKCGWEEVFRVLEVYFSICPPLPFAATSSLWRCTSNHQVSLVALSPRALNGRSLKKMKKF